MEFEAIKSERQYDSIMDIMNKGEANITKEESEKLRTMALAAQAFEKEHYYIEPPKTFQGMIELRMYELKLRQKDLAEKLGVSNAKLSLIMNGKQRPDVPFIKAVYNELNIPADFILQHI